MGTYVLLLRIRVDLGVIAMKRNSTLPKYPEEEPCCGLKKKIKIKLKMNMKKMQKPLTGKGATHAQKGTISAKERNLFYFSGDWRSDNTKIFLAAGGRSNVSVFRQRAG